MLAPDGPALFSRILLATDFTNLSAKAHRCTLALARQFAATIRLLHVIEPIGEAGEDPDLDAFYSMLTRRATSHLEQIAADFQPAGVDVDWEVALGPRAEIIAQRAEALECDLIVMGSHGLRPDRQFLPGSTSQRVPLIAPCPVLLVK